MASAAHPFLASESAAFGVPCFDRITDADFAPALRAGMAEQRAEIEQIVANPEAPTFANTVVAVENSGQLFRRASDVFDNYRASRSSAVIEETDRELAGEMAAHRLAVTQNQGLYQRLCAVEASAEYATLSEEQRALVQRYLRNSRRAGVALPDAARSRVQQVQEKLSQLMSEFSQLNQEARNAALVLVHDEQELDGLTQARRESARAAAIAAGHEGAWAFPLLSTTVHPLLSELRHRGVRERLYRASATRGVGGVHDTRPVIAQILAARAELAHALGYPTYAAYATEVQCAGTPEAVDELLSSLIPAVTANVDRERAALTELFHADGHSGELQAWDWPYYAARHQAVSQASDAAAIGRYLELERVLRDGVLFAAQQVYGLRFVADDSLPVPHPTARAYQVLDESGQVIGVSIVDLYARPSKRGGAWMNYYVAPGGEPAALPVTTVCMNLAAPAPGQPTFLSPDEVVTLFHEFGHNLHGLLVTQRYAGLGMMELPVDFVEFPSQLNEMWAFHPDVVSRYAVDPETGAPMPKELLDSLLAAESVGEGFRMAEYLASALLDLDLHLFRHGTDLPTAAELEDVERAVLQSRGLDWPGIAPRYRTSYFAHIFSSGYGAGYFAYIWSEVLARDVERWILEHGELSRSTGTQLVADVLSHGSAHEPQAMVHALLGRQVESEPLLRRRGLLAPVE